MQYIPYFILLVFCILLSLHAVRMNRWLSTWREMYDKANEANLALMGINAQLSQDLDLAQTQLAFYTKAAKGSELCRKKLAEENRLLRLTPPEGGAKSA